MCKHYLLTFSHIIFPVHVQTARGYLPMMDANCENKNILIIDPETKQAYERCFKQSEHIKVGCRLSDKY